MELAPLKEFLSEDQIATDKDSLAIYATDWTTYFQANASAVLFPTTTIEVQKIVKWARKNKIALVPSGGRTGLSGAAVAKNNEVVVSFDKMAKISDFNAVDRTVRVQAGTITENLQNYVRDQGFYFPVDFAARGSSQIGGNIATNAGGIKVIRYGLMRDWVASLTVVTGAGDILELNQGLIKNAAGYDLRQLFIGSEGTLGFITEAELKFTTPAKEKQVVFMTLNDLKHVLDVYTQFMNNNAVQAFEFLSETGMNCVVSSGHVPRPLETIAEFYLLIELEVTSEEQEQSLLDSFQQCFEQGWVSDGVISQSSQQAANFWRVREDVAENTQLHSPYRNDVSVRISRIPDFLLDMDHTLKQEYPDFTVVWYGHIGDGNLHLDILKPKDISKEDFLQRCQRVDEIVYNSVEKFAGSVSAEHGVGLTKKPHLQRSRSLAELAYFRAIKTNFDPDHIMNPGKIFD